MTRKTYIDADEYSLTLQEKLDKFWDWIEGMPVTDEMWKVEANGDMVLVVDEATMIEILEDDMGKAYEDFGPYHMTDRETGEDVIYGIPFYLLGTYTIKGVYDASQRLVDGERTYFFTQGA
jgi:hypothetical protein